jgi:hypothetical protein
MHDYMLEEMADAVAADLHLDPNLVLSSLARYWQDKIAQVWQVGDLLDCALAAGRPITRADAHSLLQAVFENHDPDLGLSRADLELELQEYNLAFHALPPDRHAEVLGVFSVWPQGAPLAHQFGVHPNHVEGNLPPALAFARQLASTLPSLPILLGGQPSAGDHPRSWLAIQQIEGQPVQKEVQEVLYV